MQLWTQDLSILQKASCKFSFALTVYYGVFEAMLIFVVYSLL